MTSRVARGCTVLLVLALGATAAEWALTFSAQRTPREPVSALVLGNQVARSQAAETVSIARLFGAQPSGEANSVRLLGVIARGTRGKGIALLSLDGQPAIAVRAGDAIAGDATLAEVQADRVLVSRSGVTSEIRLPSKPAPEGIVKAGIVKAR
jgi:general secretion pathway protein C